MNTFKPKQLSIISMLIVAVLLAACGGTGATPTTNAPAVAATTAPQSAAPKSAAPTKAPPPAPTATTPPTVEPTAAAPTLPAALSGTSIDMNNPIFKAYYAVYNKFPRRMRIETFNSKTNRTVTILIETDAKDHLHFDMTEVAGTSSITTSLVAISPTLYLKQGAAWQKLPDAQAGAMLGMLTDANTLQQMLNAFGELASYTVTPIGPEDFKGSPAMAYASEFTLKDGKSSKGKAWIGADGLLIGDHIESSEGDVITTTYDFNPNIKVEAPIP